MRSARNETLPSTDPGSRRAGVPRLRALPFLALVAGLIPAVAWASPAGQETAFPVQRSVVHYGPIVLPPAVAGQPSTFAAFVPYVPFMPCSNCYMTGAGIDLVYEDGTTANLDTGAMLHHIVMFNGSRPDATCSPETPMGGLGQRFFAAGNERTGSDLPAGFGYHLGKEPVQSAIEIMNHAAEQKTVYLKADIRWVPDSTAGMKAVTPVWLDQNNCNTSQYAVPAGPSNRVWRWTSNLTGRVLFTGGHVHDGGIKIDISNETAGQHLCTSYAGYGNNPAYMGSVESMTTCNWDRLGTVRRGETIAIDTFYDSPTAQSDVMGIVLAFVYETEDLAGGTPPPPEPAPPTGRPPAMGGGHHH